MLGTIFSNKIEEDSFSESEDSFQLILNNENEEEASNNNFDFLSVLKETNSEIDSNKVKKLENTMNLKEISNEQEKELVELVYKSISDYNSHYEVLNKSKENFIKETKSFLDLNQKYKI